MTREEEIINAANELCNSFRGGKTYKLGFEIGVKWADEHPKSPWISIDEDLPCNHKELLNPDGKGETSYVVAIIHGHIVLIRMYRLYGKWYWEHDEPTHWFPIPEPPKE